MHKLYVFPVALICLYLKADTPDLWNQFRGPNGSGVAETYAPPIVPNNKNIAWKTSLPHGFSAPTLSNSYLFLTGIREGRFITFALNKSDGQIIWEAKAPQVALEQVHKSSSPATPTPLVEKDRLYVYFGSYGLLCYNHNGKLLWKKPLPVPKSLYGTATSPISHEDTVILVVDNDKNLEASRLSKSKIYAFNKTDGSLAWETPRPLHRSGWSTPMIWTRNGKQELVVLGNGRLCGYELPGGQEKWHVTGFSRETIALPIAGGDRIFASASKLGGAADVDPDPTPFWKAVISFDANGDQKLVRKEMTGHFTFPFRPELPPGHPGFGMPLPKDVNQRKKRLDGMFYWMDKNKDGFWTKEEFISNLKVGRGKPLLVAIRPDGRGNITESHVDWELNKAIPEVPSPIYFNGRIYMVRSGGVLACVDADNGKLLYRDRLGGLGQYSASPVIASGHLYLVSEPGILSVVKADDSFKVTHQYDLAEEVVTTPAIDRDTIYIRTKKQLWAFRQE